MKLVIADTCFFVSLLLEKDSEHENAAFLMDEIEKEKQILAIFSRVIEETITVFSYKNEMKAIEDFFFFLENSPYVEILENAHSSELAFFRKLKKKISFIDASLLYHAHKSNLPLLTFDKELLKILKKM